MDQRSPTISMARAMEHSLLARRLCLTLGIVSAPCAASTYFTIALRATSASLLKAPSRFRRGSVSRAQHSKAIS
jgi:hypothetical protein